MASPSSQESRYRSQMERGHSALQGRSPTHGPPGRSLSNAEAAGQARKVAMFLLVGFDRSINRYHYKGTNETAEVCFISQIRPRKKEGVLVAFCHFLVELFSSIGRNSFLRQGNDIILPQVRAERFEIR